VRKRGARRVICKQSPAPAAGGLRLGERVLRVFNSAETGYEKPHPEAYRRVLRTLGDEVEAVRRVFRTGREEVCVPELCFRHGWQEYPARVSHLICGRCLNAESKQPEEES
jgi:hypothetical protein